MMLKQFLTRAFQLRSNGSLPMDQRSLSPEDVKRALEELDGELCADQVKLEPVMEDAKPMPAPRRKRARTVVGVTKVEKTTRNSPRRPTPVSTAKHRRSQSETSRTISPASPRNTRSNTQLVSTFAGKGIRPSQAEHASFFTMPKGQEYLPANPVIIVDPTLITDFEAIIYPVEVPSGQRGVNKQCINAEALRQLADEMRGKKELDIDSLVDTAVQALTDAVCKISEAKEPELAKPEKDRLKRLSIQFVRDIKRAQKAYMEGIDDVGL